MTKGEFKNIIHIAKKEMNMTPKAMIIARNLQYSTSIGSTRMRNVWGETVRRELLENPKI